MNGVSRRIVLLVPAGIVVAALAGCASQPARSQTTAGTTTTGANAGAAPQQPSPRVQSAATTTKRIRIEVVDRTAGQSLKPEHRAAITEEIIKRAREFNNAIEISNREDEEVSGILRANIDVFDSGNRALRFWVGLGAGKAHLRFTAQWLDGSTKQVNDSKVYQRFGAASLRTGEEIEKQMTELVGEYSQQFLSSHVK